MKSMLIAIEEEKKRGLDLEGLSIVVLFRHLERSRR